MKQHGSGISEKILRCAQSALGKWNSSLSTLDDIITGMRAESPDCAPAASSLLFEYFRHRSFVDSLILNASAKGEVKEKLFSIAVCALSQALFQTSIAPESAVNVAVDEAKRSFGRGAGNFMNAILRKAVADAGKPPYPASFPEKLMSRWENALGKDEAHRAAAACAKNPHLSFRLRSGTLDAGLEKICSLICSDITGGFKFYECSDAEALMASTAFSKGGIYIQDPATAFSISLAKDRIRGKVLDACSAPGGKTVMLCDASDPSVSITAADKSKRRLENVKENILRSGVSGRVSCTVMDALEPVFEKESFDLVFIDAPCTNTGVARRRPDALWRFGKNRLGSAVVLQKMILNSLAPLVKKGGALLYSTCSVEPEEDSRQVETFITGHPDFVLEKSGLLVPSELHDGAFAALMLKK